MGITTHASLTSITSARWLIVVLLLVVSTIIVLILVVSGVGNVLLVVLIIMLGRVLLITALLSSSASHRGTSSALVVIASFILITIVGLVSVVATFTTHMGLNALSSLFGVRFILLVVGSVSSTPSDWRFLLKSSIIVVVGLTSVVLLFRTLIQVEIIPSAHRGTTSHLSTSTAFNTTATGNMLISIIVVVVTLRTSSWALLTLIVDSLFIIAVIATTTHGSSTATRLSLLPWVGHTLLNIYFVFKLLLRFCFRFYIHVIVVSALDWTTASTTSSTTSGWLISSIGFFFQLWLGSFDRLIMLDWGFVLRWLFWRGGCLVSRVGFIKLFLGQNTIKGSDFAYSLCGFESLDLGFVFVCNDHGLNFVYLV